MTLADPLTPTAPEEDGVRSTGFRAILRHLRADRWALGGAITVAIFLVMAVFAPILTGLNGQDPYAYNLDALDEGGAPLGPGGGISPQHWFGVEPLTGRDLFSIVVFGARTSLVVAFGATAMAVVIGLLIGVTMGYFGGWWDRLLSRVIDIMLGFPSLVFMIALTAIVPREFPRLLLLVLIIGFFGFPAVARIARAQTFTVRERNFVVASVAMGSRPLHVLISQVLPNVVPTMIVYATVMIPGMIGAEAALSFLGIGISPPTPSWGRTIGDAVNWAQISPMYLVFPGLALFSVTLAFNLLGDGLRDALDPRRKGGDR